MANEDMDKRNNGVGPDADAGNNNGESGDDKPKSEEESKKEFFLIRGVKAVWHGVKTAAHAVNEFTHEHPYVVAGITTAVGYGARIVVDSIRGGSEDSEEVSTSVPELPAPEEDNEASESEIYEPEMPAEEMEIEE